MIVCLIQNVQFSDTTQIVRRPAVCLKSTTAHIIGKLRGQLTDKRTQLTVNYFAVKRRHQNLAMWAMEIFTIKIQLRSSKPWIRQRCWQMRANNCWMICAVAVPWATPVYWRASLFCRSRIWNVIAITIGSRFPAPWHPHWNCLAHLLSWKKFPIMEAMWKLFPRCLRMRRTFSFCMWMSRRKCVRRSAWPLLWMISMSSGRSIIFTVSPIPANMRILPGWCATMWHCCSKNGK